ncbi:potassium transporter Kup [Frigidibacter sp. MR17.14]|uniref:potassium transporter Kup n=1 Tax=Frigidibacter sp. MR17.14 TaxID=3126509 RepID=UPI0030131A07
MASSLPGTGAPSPAGAGYDEDELDIAAYLDAEADAEAETPHSPQGQSLPALALGALGVVYGDIGTSPIYAFREALRPVAEDGLERAEVLGLLSLLIWAVLLVVTVKYVLFLLKQDNRGEGGILALYTLVRLAIGRRSIPVLLLGIAGSALFFGDAIITPAISVLSAVEGGELVAPHLAPWVVSVTVVILLGLFWVQKGGTVRVSRFFGPICLLWFLVLGLAGLVQIAQHPSVLSAFSPWHALTFLAHHRATAFIVMGAVFLAVTGAEALYADLGHFGRKPIVVAWFALVMPALLLNYLGQGAIVLRDPASIEQPFFAMIPAGLLAPFVLLTTLATIIASQAVISGAFSMTRAAMQLGLLPRMRIRHTSADQSGQIYVPVINWALLAGVLWLVIDFRSSEALAAAYGLAVTGTMVLTTILVILYLKASGRLPWPLLLGLVPIGLFELSFLAANVVKIPAGGYVPVLVATVLGLMMWCWWAGTQAMLLKNLRNAVSFESFRGSIERSAAKGTVEVVPGTAFFLTADPSVVPSALLHNIKHNRVLHDRTVLMTVESLRMPVALPEERIELEVISDRFARLTLRFGFMEDPNVARGLMMARARGLKFDVMSTSFFLGRKRPVPAPGFILDRMQRNVFALLYRFSADPTDYFRLPRNRVIELGERVTF